LSRLSRLLKSLSRSPKSLSPSPKSLSSQSHYPARVTLPLAKATLAECSANQRVTAMKLYLHQGPLSHSPFEPFEPFESSAKVTLQPKSLSSQSHSSAKVTLPLQLLSRAECSANQRVTAMKLYLYQGFGFRVWGSWFRVARFMVLGLWLREYGPEIQGVWFRVYGLWFIVQGFTVYGFGFIAWSL